MVKTTSQDLKDLSKAHSYANWSIFGIIVPIVGLILAGMSLNFLSVIPKNEDTNIRLRQVKRTAYLGIAVSLIAILFWGGLYKYNSLQNDKEQVSLQAEIEYKRSFIASCLGSNNLEASQCECALNLMINQYAISDRPTYENIFKDTTTTSAPEFYIKKFCQ